MTKKYQIIAAPAMENMAESIVKAHPDRFLYHPTKWGKFPDGTDTDRNAFLLSSLRERVRNYH